MQALRKTNNLISYNLILLQLFSYLVTVKKRTKKWLAVQFEAPQRAEKVRLKKLDDCDQENIVAIYF